MDPLTPPASSPDSPSRLRLLIPVDVREEFRAAIRHAQARAAAGEALEVFLVAIVPPIGGGDVVRFRAEQQDAERLQARAGQCLEEAAAELRRAGVPCHGFVREADSVQGIRDSAEEWACAEALLPKAARPDLFGGSQRRRLKELEQALRVTWVWPDGTAEEEKKPHAP